MLFFREMSDLLSKIGRRLFWVLASWKYRRWGGGGGGGGGWGQCMVHKDECDGEEKEVNPSPRSAIINS